MKETTKHEYEAQSKPLDIEEIYDTYTILLTWAEEIKIRYTELTKETEDFLDGVDDFFSAEYERVLSLEEQKSLTLFYDNLKYFYSTYDHDMLSKGGEI